MKKILAAFILFAATMGAFGQSDFFDLVTKGSVKQIEAALKSGAAVNEKGLNGRRPLMAAAEYNAVPEVIAALVKAGAKVGPAIVGVGEADDVRLALGAGALPVAAGTLDDGNTEAGRGACGLAPLPQPASETSTATRQPTDAITALDTP